MKLLFALCVVLLCGCGPKEGRVISRDFEPAHTETICTTAIDADDDVSLLCEDENIPDKWFITVTLDCTNTGTWECSQWDFDNASNGAWFRAGVGIVPEPSVEKGKQ